MSAPDLSDPSRVRAFLARRPPFDGLDDDQLTAVAAAARSRRYRRGELVLDAFRRTNDTLFVVVGGQVQVWTDNDPVDPGGEEVLGSGGLFGYSAMLTGRSIGPRVVALVDDTLVLRMPGALVAPAFATGSGTRFLAAQAGRAGARTPAAYTLVDDLVVTEPPVVPTGTTVAELAREMTARGWSAAAVRLPEGGYGLVSDALLRARVLAAPGPPPTTAGEVMEPRPPTVRVGSSAAEALIRLLDSRADAVLVTDPDGRLRGMVGAADFMVAPTSAGLALHEQLRRATSIAELQRLARMVPGLLTDLLDRGLPSARVIAVHSAIVDTVVGQAIRFVFADRPELPTDRFTWLALGSHGRREAVLSSDVDAAVAFDDDVTPGRMTAYRDAFGQVGLVLQGCGLATDSNGATPARAPFARRNAQWRAAALAWRRDPAADNGAMMTSLLVDGRPVLGDPGTPQVSRVFADLRRHPGTLRLLLAESLSRRARLHSLGDVLRRRTGIFDIKAHALLPIVNIARWAALSRGSAALPTVDRLEAAAGSSILPTAQAATLIEVFEVLQRLRLHYQLGQHVTGRPAGDIVDLDRLSPIDRSVISRAVREIAAVQKRMENISGYLPASEWTAPDPG